MWSRAELKARAKAVLRTNYWKAFLISLVILVAAGKSGGGGGGNHGGGNGASGDWFSRIPDQIVFISIIALVFVSVVAFTFAMAFRIFLGYPLEVGGRRYFVRSALYRDNKGCFGYAFSGQNYKGIIITMLLKGIFNFLWFLLFIIPGIVKAYSYSMVPYILANNPNIGYKRAIELSNRMTDGHKWNMFVLDLSFIGWYLLGLLALVIGTLFVNPYFNATKAELYLSLRENALNNGLCTAEELALENE